ncbi:hypothetical protein CCACVL1_21189 [Corchorus capsularis]|uniref:Bifunctional inhibitor/plant lipid transfer protein/seed storage helical domain-containing protein n=1 Tax=Corchorus capsularis TaxID=210143 RepID=A0A1R3H7W0_COCAP|nr:hypothetical protein CCACVL1_21189 [Corchorus capsularis]
MAENQQIVSPLRNNMVKPCNDYFGKVSRDGLNTSDVPSFACCEGVWQLNKLSFFNRPSRQLVCECINEVYREVRFGTADPMLQERVLQSLPTRCNVTFPFKLMSAPSLGKIHDYCFGLK